MNSGIYSITNCENGKRYIGRTVDFDKRKAMHFWQLENNRHPNNHLQRAWNDGQKFEFEIVERCAPSECNEREIYWIAFFDAMRTGYNQCAGGNATLGRVCSDSARQKISEKAKGRSCSVETIEKRRESLKRHLERDAEFAKKYHEDHSRMWRGKPSWNKGMPCPEWLKERNRQAMIGRTVTEEHRQKLRELYSGEKSITAKLKKSDVVEIRYRFLCGERQTDIRRDYAVTAQTIYDIVRGRRWRSVPMELDELRKLRTQGEVANGKTS